MKLSGLSLGSLAMLEACKRNPLNKMLGAKPNSYLADPSKKNYYPTACGMCSKNCPILVKTFENKPIKIEENKESKVNLNGICNYGQASVLGLYDENRQQFPAIKGKEVSWKIIDKEIISKFEEISRNNGNIMVVTKPVNSPSSLKAINIFKERFKNVYHYTFDDYEKIQTKVSFNRRFFSKKINLKKAKIIVGLNAKFLDDHSIFSIKKQWEEIKSIEKNYEQPYFIQFGWESCLTSANSDELIKIKPSQEAECIEFLIYRSAEKARVNNHKLNFSPDISKFEKILNKSENDFNLPENIKVKLNEITDLLYLNEGYSVLISETNDAFIQDAIRKLNEYFSSHNIINWDIIPEEYISLDYFNVGPRKSEFKAIIVEDVVSLMFDSILQNTDKSTLLISLSSSQNNFEYHCPDNHYLESWNDNEIELNKYSFSQPTVSPLFNTRQFQDSLLTWAGYEKSYRELFIEHWENKIRNTETKDLSELFKNGFFDKNPDRRPGGEHLTGIYNRKRILETKNKTEYFLFLHPYIYNGEQFNNPWLRELPHPVHKISWVQYCTISKDFAIKNKVEEGDVIDIFIQGKKTTLPAHIEENQVDNTIGIPLGYPDHADEGFYDGLKYRYLYEKNPALSFNGIIEGFKKTGEKIQLPKVQENFEPEGFDLEMSFADYQNSKLNHPENFIKKDRKFVPHHWAMVIDLNKCIGCNNCVLGCQTENNIPVIGKKEMEQGRNMHWMNILKYNSEENKTNFLPMLCQHCDDAPCESVCPVAATSNSKEGLNQQVYNRCIGTRFCASACPYKVRKFNFGEYAKQNPVTNTDFKKLILNPEVYIREKGIIEKCSFCFQRIEEAKTKAKKIGQTLKDGDVKTACQSVCPTNAIYFGDLNDKSSKVHRLLYSKRIFRVLEDLNTNSSVFYLKKVRKENA
jgi:Fe-S-cluster-containing dehydrogenase component